MLSIFSCACLLLAFLREISFSKKRNILFKESWVPKIDAFELWFWKRLLRVPWTARRSNQSILKEISPGCSLERLMLKLKLQYFGHLMWRSDSLEKTLMLGKIEGGGEGDDRGWAGWMASLTWWTWVWVNSGSSWWTGRPGVLQSMGSQRVRHDWATELTDWLAVTKFKLALLATHQTNEWELRCWGMEYDFIRKANWPREWQTNVSK